jgi:hypothetical protein
VATLRRALREDKAVVYAAAGGRLRNFTRTYRAVHEQEWRSLPALSTRVEPASELYAEQLGKGWLAIGGGARWMGEAATASLGAVPGPAKLVIEGYCPKVQFSGGPFRLQPRIDGAELGQGSIGPPDERFRLEFPLQNVVPPTDRVEVLLEIDHTVLLPDGSHASVMISSIFFEPS